MPKIAYIKKRFKAESLSIIDRAIGIVEDYAARGYELSLRQLYYQFVAGEHFPASWADRRTGSTNNEASYKKLGSIIADARMAGLIDWNHIKDRTREMAGIFHWNSPAHLIETAASNYKIDLWQGQRYRVEVWVEKDALESIVAGVCSRFDVPYFSCRGYTSSTAMWENAQRMLGYSSGTNVSPVVLHLGDHDPSGIDMSRDIEERLRMFLRNESTWFGDCMMFQRIALNRDQIEKYNPPENPAKSTDCRYAKYRDEHGEASWELDALDPDVLSSLIEYNIKDWLDIDAYNKAVEKQETERAKIGKLATSRTLR